MCACVCVAVVFVNNTGNRTAHRPLDVTLLEIVKVAQVLVSRSSSNSKGCRTRSVATRLWSCHQDSKPPNCYSAVGLACKHIAQVPLFEPSHMRQAAHSSPKPQKALNPRSSRFYATTPHCRTAHPALGQGGADGVCWRNAIYTAARRDCTAYFHSSTFGATYLIPASI